MSDTLSDTRLAELQTAITQWRQTRRGGQIPAEIGRAAVALLTEYRPKALQRALTIDYKTLMRWKTLYGDEVSTPGIAPSAPAPGAAAFVALAPSLPVETPPLPEVAGTPAVPPTAMPVKNCPEVPAALTLTLTHHPAEGAALSLAGTLTLTQWQSVVTLFQAVRA